ncbi:MAG: recombinase family protein [Alistipes sp.]|nr:recombinase family protein [Alistipes sp.]
MLVDGKEREKMPTVTVIQPTMTGEKSKLIRCAAYCRVSSDSEDQLNSFMAQTRYYSQIFENSETETLIDIYADEGVTGTREDKREEFQRMMKDCRKGKIDRIYTKSISRFARNTRDCLKNVRELKSLGITICFEKERIDTANVTDEMMITIMGGLAQEESTSISQNVRWSIQKRMQNGTYRNSTPPFGFRNEAGKLVVDEKQAEIVRQMFEWYVSGCGLKKIADMLNEMNISSGQRCVPWQAKTVQYVLKNERYIGDVMYQKSYITETLPHMKKTNNGEKSQYYVTAVNDSIIEKTIFDAAQKLMKSRNGKHIDNHLILSKRIYCKKCGATYKFKSCNGKRYWTCRTHDIKADLCENGWILESDIYAAFIRLCNKLMCNYKQILVPLHTSLLELKLRKFNDNSNVMEMHKEIAKLKEQTHVLARLKTKGFLDNTKYLEQTTELTAKINKMQSELKKLTRSDDEDEALEQLEMLIDYFENRESPITEFNESDFENIVEKIVVINQNELEFHLIGGLKFTEKI